MNVALSGAAEGTPPEQVISQAVDGGMLAMDVVEKLQDEGEATDGSNDGLTMVSSCSANVGMAASAVGAIAFGLDLMGGCGAASATVGMISGAVAAGSAGVSA